MARTIRFHLDENLDGSVASGLRMRGVDITTTPEQGLLGVTDEDQLAFAAQERRVLVTHDDDLLILHRLEFPHAGIAFCHPTKYSIGGLIYSVLLIWEVLEPEDMVGRIEFL